MQIDIKKIIDLRMKLHRMPEISGEEEKTAAEIEKQMKKYKPDEIIDVANTGKIIIFDSKNPGPTTAFRAELDGLPIPEPEHFYNKSLNAGISHKCGHDGHMAILVGLAETISYNKPKKGKVALIFQPAEETLTGAEKILKDENFRKINPDYVFALHNLPNFPENMIIIKKNHFTAATIGTTIEITGNTSHAAAPEKANNPTNAVIELLNYINTKITKEKYNKFVLATPVFTKIGNPDFGITPGNAQIKTTFRAFDQTDLKKLTEKLEQKTHYVCQKHKLTFKIKYSDSAPPIMNNPELTKIVENIAIENNFAVKKIEQPFKWTDDFGYISQKHKSCFFGFGIGQQYDLHNKLYQFNDNAILPAIKIFHNVYLKINK